MNILFILKSLDMGGVEVVTAVLASKFKKENHDVSIFSFTEGSKNLLSRCSNDAAIWIGNGLNSAHENVQILRDILVNKKIDIIINQWSLPYAPIKTVTKARKGLGVKVISVYHNDPINNGRVQMVDMELDKKPNELKRIFLYSKRKLFEKITSQCMAYTYNNSDKFIILSDSYRSRFSKFTGIKSPTKLLVQINPITINVNFDEVTIKQKEVIYCGRIDSHQKRVHRLIDVWRIIEKECSDWKLTIVGDGECRKEIENQVETYGLRNVFFEGFQQPIDYYKRASILVLSSEYEGFPLVLAECMSFGVVPIVLDSFAAAKDIVHHLQNGVLVPYDKNVGFDAELYASMLRDIMNNDNFRRKMSNAAIETSKEYSIDTIYQQWMKIFQNLDF